MVLKVLPGVLLDADPLICTCWPWAKPSVTQLPPSARFNVTDIAVKVTVSGAALDASVLTTSLGDSVMVLAETALMV